MPETNPAPKETYDYLPTSIFAKLGVEKNAHPSVKEVAKYEACSNDNFGVLETIKNFLGKFDDI